MGDRVSGFVGKSLIYQPEYARMVGSVTAALFLRQVAFWDEIKRGEPFYKFNAPCRHKLYLEGDSWEEELGFSRSELDGARNKTGTKITKDSELSKEDALMVVVAEFDDKGVMTNANRLIIYWTDSDRVTHYVLNRALLNDALEKFAVIEERRKEKLMQKTCNSYCGKPALPGNAENPLYPYSENTSENTKTDSHSDESNGNSSDEHPAEPQQASLLTFPSLGCRSKKQKGNGSQQEKAKRTGAPRTPNPNTLPIMDAYVQALGYSPANYAKESGFAKRLAAMGYTPEQVSETYRRMKAQPFWQGKFLSLCKVAEQIGEDFPPHAAKRASGETSPSSGYRFLNDETLFP